MKLLVKVLAKWASHLFLVERCTGTFFGKPFDSIIRKMKNILVLLHIL